RVLGQVGTGADATAEIKQDIRRCVLVGTAGPGQIVDFTGRGSLRSWVHVIAARQALRRRRRARREVALEDDDLLRLVACASPELEHQKACYREAFKQAFRDA